MSQEPLPKRMKEGTEFAEASLWVSRIISTIAPGLVGLWADDKFGTRYWAITGLVFGLISGVLQFTQATKGVFKKTGSRPPADSVAEKQDDP